MTYLDDPDHDWSLEYDDDETLEDMIRDMAKRQDQGEDSSDIRMVLRGYAGLKARLPEATDEQCLRTSMIWWYG